MSFDLQSALDETAQRVENYFQEFLTDDTQESQLISAMRYAALRRGKAFRAFLCLEAGRLAGAAAPHAERVAAAVEAVHCYSLIHDDLPAMDDDDTRRGQPALHIAYDEATALLGGTGLLTLGFEILADKQTHPNAETRTQLVAELSLAVGARGMLQGQMLDIENKAGGDVGALVHLHSLKTGALIRYAVRAGAILGGGDPTTLETLSNYANAIGLAYQIADDLLDAETEGAEATANLALALGLVEARHEARRLVEKAQAELAQFGEAAEPLHLAAAFVIERKN